MRAYAAVFRMKFTGGLQYRAAALAGLEGLPQRVQVLPNDAAAVKQLIREALEA